MNSSKNTDKDQYFSDTNIDHQLKNIVEQCEEICEYVILMLKQKEDTRLKEKEIQLLRDCVNMCKQVRTFSNKI